MGVKPMNSFGGSGERVDRCFELGFTKSELEQLVTAINDAKSYTNNNHLNAACSRIAEISKKMNSSIEYFRLGFSKPEIDAVLKAIEGKITNEDVLYYFRHGAATLKDLT